MIYYNIYNVKYYNIISKVSVINFILPQYKYYISI